MKSSFMLNMEISDTLKQTGTVLAFLAVIPPVYLVNSMRLGGDASFAHHAFYGSLFTVAFLMMTLATSMFRRERSDDAMQYLKTLPLSPARVAARKIIPRLFASWIVAVLFAIVFFRGLLLIHRSGSVLDAVFTVNVILLAPALLMAGGFLFDVSGRKSPVLALMLALPALFVFTAAGNGWFPLLRLFLRLWRWSMTPGLFHAAAILSVALGVVLPAMLPLLVLVPVYRAWVRTPERVLTRRMIRRAIIPAVALLALFVLYFL